MQEIDWDWNLTNHRPTEEGIEKIEELRQAAKDYVAKVKALTPVGREQSLALSHFETATFYVNASIARTETDDLNATV